jgi:hypothetical protein
MRHRMLAAILASSALLLAACGDDDTGGGGAGGGTATAGGDAVTAATAGGATSGSGPGGVDPGAGGAGGGASELRTLLETDWTLEPGTETYLCQRLTVDQDVWISEFHPLIPEGTHHTVVTLVDAGEAADGTRECTSPFEGGFDQIYGTGVGTQPLIMPPGVAVKIPAGKQIVMNLHLFNAGAARLDGTSGILVREVDPGDVEHEADSELWGKLDFTIEPNGTTTATQTCVVESDLQLFSMMPHMHTLGRHLKLTLGRQGGEEVVLYDDAYDFDAQVNRPFDPSIEIVDGDTMTIACTWDNPTSDTVTFGESTNDEMCFAGLWVYPAGQVFCPLF